MTNVRKLTLSLLAAFLSFSGPVQLLPAMGQEVRIAAHNPDWVARQQTRQLQERGFQAQPGGVQTGAAYGDEPPLVDYSYLKDSIPAGMSRAARALPSRFDPRDNHLVGEIRNQGDFKTCWAHASLGSIETWLLQHKNCREDLSEANLIQRWNFDGDGCDGGSAPCAAAILLRGEGPVAEADDPYPEGLHEPKSVPTPLRYSIQQYRIIPGKRAPLAHDHIKEAIMQFGGLYTSFHLIQAPPFLNRENATYYYDGEEKAGHAVTLVGWDDAFPKNRFAKTPPGDGAYIAKNSYGPTWGENGFFYVSYYDTDFACRTMHAFPDARNPGSFDCIYQYDSLGDCTHIDPPFGANLFQADADSTLTAVGFYLLDPRSSHEIRVYTGCAPDDPVSGTLVLTQTGSQSHAGFYAVPLEREIPLRAGERFSVVVHFSPVYGENSLAVEYAEKGYSSNASALPGESFYSFTGESGSWADLQTLAYFNGTANLCIKAYAKSRAADRRAGTPEDGYAGVQPSGALGAPKINPEFVAWQARRRRARDSGASGDGGAGTPDEGKGRDREVTGGWMPPPVDFSYLSARSRELDGAEGRALPEKYDLRRECPMTPVRNQDPENRDIASCWAHATVGSMETWLAKDGEPLQQLSVKHLINGTGYDRPDPEEPRGWFFGTPLMSAAYLLRWGGPVGESKDPYLKPDGKLNYSLESPELPAEWHLQQVRIVPRRTGSLDNAALKQAVLDFGGVFTSIALYAPESTPWSGKRLSCHWSTNGAYYCGETEPGHAVTLVGWDDTYPRENFNPELRPDGDGAFIVKDSYGTEAPRDGGYVYVSYYDTSFACQESWAFPLLERPDNYSAIYQHDPLGLTGLFELQTNVLWLANVFTAKEDGNLEAVGVYLLTAKAPYAVSIYTDCRDDNPASGRKCTEQRGNLGVYAGYYTIKLDQSVPLRKGQRFSVVVELDAAADGIVRVPYEDAQPDYSSRASAAEGESFYSFAGPGYGWIDFWRESKGTGNFCIKAYATLPGQQPSAGTTASSPIPVAGPSVPSAGEPHAKPKRPGIWGLLPDEAYKTTP